jgi:hypothetical protein
MTMKPYGMKRIDVMPYPDLADISNMAAPSRFGKTVARKKAATRRIQKRSARRVNRALCVES